jgi:ABC-type bacteriocin/lantibiotic exporter with double-glycine peptidase domain
VTSLIPGLFVAAATCVTQADNVSRPNTSRERDLHASCGASALKIVLAVHSLESSCQAVDDLLPEGQRSLRELAAAAEHVGLVTRAVNVSSKRLGEAPVGACAILHLVGPADSAYANGHYIAAVRVTPARWRYVDFPRLSVNLSDESVAKWWTGHALFVTRSDEQLGFLDRRLEWSHLGRWAKIAAPMALVGWLAFAGVRAVRRSRRVEAVT